MKVSKDDTAAEVEVNEPTYQELEDAAFLQAMTSDDDGPIPPAQEGIQEEGAAEPEAEAEDPGQESEEEVEGEEAKPVREEVFAGFTAEELSAHLAEIPKLQKQLDKVNGTFGQRFADQNREIESLRNRPAAHAASKLSPGAFTKLKEEFPELGALLAEEIQAAMVPGEPAGFDASMLKGEIAKELTAFERKQQEKSLKRLEKVYPDWEDLAGYVQDEATGFSTWKNAEFGNWVATLPGEAQQDIVTTDDPLDLLDYLNEFNQAKKTEVKSEEVKPTIPVVKKTSKSVFGKAIKAKSTTGAEKALTAKEEEDAAFLKAMMDEDF